WYWITARELDAQLATNPKMVLDVRRSRKRAAGGLAVTATATTAAAWWLVTPAAPILALLMVLAVAGAAERRVRALGDAEAGRAALGNNPTGKEVKRVIVAAKLARKV